MTNYAFSDDWYSIFLDPIPTDRTLAEVDFVARHLPLGEYGFILDLCCGSGRHAADLAHRGYNLIGVDANESAIQRAQALNLKRAQFYVQDMRHVDELGMTFDAVVNLWHSFGYFDDDANQQVIQSLAHILRPGGRLIFDIYNRDYFTPLPAQTRRKKTALQSRPGARGVVRVCKSICPIQVAAMMRLNGASTAPMNL